jgi:hypothetical protein
MKIKSMYRGGFTGMNTQNSVLSQTEIEKYICEKLKEIYWKFPKKIVPSTTFKALEKHHDPYFVDPGLLIYIEEDLGIYLPDEAALALDGADANVGALIDAVFKHRPTATECVDGSQPSQAVRVETVNQAASAL